MRGHLDRPAAILLPAGTVPGACVGEVVPWGALRYEHAAMPRGVLAARHDVGAWAAATVSAHLSALRGIITEAWRLGYIDADQRGRATDINLKSVRQPTGRDIHDEEIAPCSTRAASRARSRSRGVAVTAWLWSTGDRRAEAAAQLIERYNRKERAVKILGKGDKERTGYIHPEAASYVGLLTHPGQRADRGRCSAPSTAGATSSPGTSPLRAIGQIVERRRLAARLDPLSTHHWRRTFVGDLLDAGADLVLVQALAGHGSPAATALYDRRPERQRRDAVDRGRMPGASDRA